MFDLESYRKHKGLKQSEIALLIGIHQSIFQRLNEAKWQFLAHGLRN